jgi:hypothetical protein
MDFDIHQLDHIDPESEDFDAALDTFRQELLERFAQSPEGQERLEAEPDVGAWAAQLIYFGYQYEGKTLPQMTVRDVRTVVGDLFPRKVSLESPDEAGDVIPELIAFWKYLKREFQLPHADSILEYLRELEPDFPDVMNDPSNFGMARSLFSMGGTAGFDMTSREGVNAFMDAFNSRQFAGQMPPLPPTPMSSLFGPERRLDPAARKAEKKKRKQVEAAKKRNRKRRK